MGDFQTAATTGLSLVGMWVWEVGDSYVHPSIHAALCPRSCFSPSIRWRSGWPLGPAPAVAPLFPHISHVLTTSRWCRGEDCGRAINWAPVPCQTKLPRLFLQQSPSNYGFHTCREQSWAIWCCFVTVTCYCAANAKQLSSRRGWGETG